MVKKNVSSIIYSSDKAQITSKGEQEVINEDKLHFTPSECSEESEEKRI